VRLVDLRLLEGPNVYRLEPTVKVEVVVGRRRTWYGQRSPGEHMAFRLGRPVAESEAPGRVAEIVAWVRVLHELTGAADWLRREPRREGRPALTELPVTLHQTSEPGHWIVAFPWRERDRAQLIAETALRFAERGLDAADAPNAAQGRTRSARIVESALRTIRDTSGSGPAWVRDEQREIPIVSISGTNGKSTTTRMITHILRLANRHVGTTTSDGVLVDEQLVEPGDWTGPGGAAAVLKRPEVQVAVLETARGGMLLKGMGYESNDVSVLTNVSSDHLDLMGLHTLPELAEVKSVITRITRPEGAVVLNADDHLVAAVASEVQGHVWYFSLDPANRIVREHLRTGGNAMVLDNGALVERDRTDSHRLMNAAEAPATLLGLARHNIANALAAACAARALGVDRRAIAEGLRDFQPSAELAPGRLNLYRVGERIVIVDFAHNEAGVSVLMDVAKGVARAGGRDAPRPIVAIVGTAGDRPDDTLRGVGRIAAEHADRLALKETQRYLRGRSRESVIGEIRAGMAEAGVDVAAIPIFPDEPGALDAMLAGSDGIDAAALDAVVVLLCHEDREGVAEIIERLGGRPLDPAVDLAVATSGAAH
jgi:cyanophycin synthetase